MCRLLCCCCGCRNEDESNNGGKTIKNDFTSQSMNPGVEFTPPQHMPGNIGQMTSTITAQPSKMMLYLLHVGITHV